MNNILMIYNGLHMETLAAKLTKGCMPKIA